MKRSISLLLVFSMMLCMCAACGSKTENSAPTSTEPKETANVESASAEVTPSVGGAQQGTSAVDSAETEIAPISFPLFEEPVTLTYMGEGSPWNMSGDVVWSQALQTIDEMANVQWKQTWLTMFTGTDTFNLVIASGDYPDVISNFYKYYTNGIQDGIEQEIIIDMDEPIREYMPNYMNIVNSDPEITRQASTDDGKIWGVQLISNPVQDSFNGPIARADLMEKYQTKMNIH